MADRLVTETEKSQRKRHLMEAAQIATTASASASDEGSGEAEKEKPKKEEKGKLARVKDAAVDAGKATVKGVQEGGKKVADAVYPAALNENTPSAGGRAVDAGLGLLEQAMAALGVNAGASIGGSVTSGENENDPAPLPDVAHKALREIESVFASPQLLRDFHGAKTDEDRARIVREAGERSQKPFTRKELGEFVGGFIAPAALHKAMSGKAPAKPSAEPGKPAAPAAAPKPAAPAGPVDPGPFPRNGTLKEKNAWNDAQKAYRKAKPVEEAPKAVEPPVAEPSVGGDSPLDAAINAPDKPAAAPDYHAALHEATLSPEGFGGATFDPRTGAPAPYGDQFVVANTKGGAMRTPIAEFTPEVSAEFARQHAAEFAEPDAFHGTWTKTAEGNVYQDVSRRKPSLAEAQKIAAAAEEPQQMIWDEANNAEIPVSRYNVGPATEYKGRPLDEMLDANPGTTVLEAKDWDGGSAGTLWAQQVEGGFRVKDVRTTGKGTGAGRELYKAARKEYGPYQGSDFQTDQGKGFVDRLRQTDPDIFAADKLPEEQRPLAAETTEPIAPAEEPQAPPTGDPAELDPRQMDPLATTPEEVAAAVPAEQTPVKPDPFLEGTEAAGAQPDAMPTNTVADLHAAAAPLIEQVAAEAKAEVAEGLKALKTEAQVREEANTMAAEMRAQGKNRAEINEAYRAKLNEHGIESKKQKAAKPPKSETAPVKTEPVIEEGNKESAPALPPVEEEFNAALARIKKRVGEMLDLTDETGAVSMRGSIAEGMRKNSETYNDLKVIGAGMLHYGARDFSAWSDAMRSVLVESGHDVTNLDPYLKGLYTASQKQLKFFNKTSFKDELPSIVELREAAKRGEPGYEWYDRAPQELKARFGDNADLWAGSYAATSPLQNAATTNIDLAHRAFNQIMTGERDGVKRKFTPTKDGIMDVVATNLNRVARGERVSGPKIHPFEGQLRQDAFTSGARDIAVIDTWMYRLLGFMTDNPTDVGGKKQGTQAGRLFLETLITKMAAETGADVAQVQASLWTDVKARVERARATADAMDANGQWKAGWDLDRLDAALQKITDEAGTPFDRLLLNRLGPAVEAVRQGDMTGNGDALAVRKATMAMIENKAQPEASATVALQGLGMMKDAASKVATAVADAYRASGLSDETGSFNFWKKAEDTAVPYDIKGAETVMGEKVSEHGVKDILRTDLNKPITPEQGEAMVAKAEAARDALFADLQTTMDLMHQGIELPPGQLFHTATLAGAVADKVRSAANRYGADREPGRIVGGEKPVGAKALTDFGEQLHAAMTEPELYAKLRSLSPEGRMGWLGNTHRAGPNAGRLYMTLYMNEMLSSPYTLLKATAGDASTLPLSIGNRFLAEQWGRGFNMLENMGWLTKSDTHVVPGEAVQKAINYWENMKDQISMLSRRDWDGIHQQMVDAGEFRPPIANPESLAGSMVNAVAGAPGSFLGVERSSHMVISRLGEMRAQAWRQATLEGKTGEALVKQTEFYQRNPTKDMMQAAVNSAEENAFTRRMDGVFAKAIQQATSGDLGKVIVDPFANITMNIMDYTMQGTPGLNLLSKRWRAEFQEGGAARDMAMGKLSMGTVFIGTAAYMGMQGLVTGDGPRDPAVRKIWEQAGWRSNYVYNPATGKPMFSHLALGPISGWLAAGADMAFMFRHTDKQSAETLVAGTVLALMEPLSHAGYIEVISDVTRGIKEGIADGSFWKMVRDKIGAAALVNPGILRAASEVENLGAKPMSTPPRGDSFIERELKMLFDDVMKQKPGWSENYPQQRNFITGKAVPRDGAAPWYHEVTSNKIAKEIDRLGQNEGKGAKFAVLQPPSFIGGQIPQEGVQMDDPSPYEAIRLESWEKDRLIQLLTEKPRQGQTLETRLEALIESSKYKRMTDGQYGTKAMAIQSVYHQYVYAAQQDLLKEDKHLHWLVEEQQVRQAKALGKDIRNPLGAEPKTTTYPRPGQKERD